MNRVIHFEIQADDLERAKKFYQNALGWKIEKWGAADSGVGMEYWVLKTGEGPGIDGGMYKRSQHPGGEKFYTYDCTIQVQDIDKAMADVKSNGGKIVANSDGKEKMEIPGLGWFARAFDTEGNRFGLMQPTDWKPK